MKMHLLLAVMTSYTLLMCGCMFETRYVDFSENYSQMIGEEYRLKVDCYIVDYGGTKPYSIIDAGGLNLPQNPKKEYIGKRFGDKLIRGILYKGTTFKVNKIYHLEGFNVSGFDIYVKLLDSKIYSDTLSAQFLRDYSNYSPFFNQKYVEKVKSKNDQNKIFSTH